MSDSEYAVLLAKMGEMHLDIVDIRKDLKSNGEAIVQQGTYLEGLTKLVNEREMRRDAMCVAHNKDFKDVVDFVAKMKNAWDNISLAAKVAVGAVGVLATIAGLVAGTYKWGKAILLWLRTLTAA